MSSLKAAGEFYLENFAQRGVEAEIQHLEQQPGFDAVKRRFFEEGHRAGKLEAAAAFAAERQVLVAGPLAALEQLIAGLAKERSEFYVQNERELIGLATAIARRILRVELRGGSRRLTAVLAELCQAMSKESAYLVRVNADEIASVEQLLQQEGRSVFGDTPFQIKPDPRLPVGTVALEGCNSRLESIWSEELNRIEEMLLGDIRDKESAND